MNKVDCLVIHIPGREKYLDECLNSLKPAEDKLNIIVVRNECFLPQQQVRYDHFHSTDSKIVTWVNDDDLFVNSGALEECLMKLENSNVVGASTTASMINQDGSVKRERYNPHPYNKKLHQQTTTHVHELTLVKKDIAIKYIDETYLYLDDHHSWYLTNMMVRHGQWFKSNKIGYKWRIHCRNEHLTADINQANYARQKFLTP
jgi:GT2 family glycosyltransferase